MGNRFVLLMLVFLTVVVLSKEQYVGRTTSPADISSAYVTKEEAEKKMNSGQQLTETEKANYEQALQLIGGASTPTPAAQVPPSTGKWGDVPFAYATKAEFEKKLVWGQQQLSYDELVKYGQAIQTAEEAKMYTPIEQAQLRAQAAPEEATPPSSAGDATSALKLREDAEKKLVSGQPLTDEELKLYTRARKTAEGSKVYTAVEAAQIKAKELASKNVKGEL